MTSVAIIEDHPVYRHGLMAVIDGADDLMVSVLYGSVEEFLAHLPDAADVVVVDLHLPGLGGAEGVRAVGQCGPRVLVVLASAEPEVVVVAIGAGASGYLTKGAEADEIVRAIATIAGGATYISPVLASYLLNANRATDQLRVALSKRAQEILALVAAGERDQDIAEQLFIGVATVRSHLDRIRDKTGRRRRPDLTRLAVESGIMPRTEPQ